MLPVPEAALAYFSARKTAGRAEPVGDVIPEGSRHRTLLSIAGTMRRRGMGLDAIAAALREENKKCRTEDGQPAPLPDEEVVEIAADVVRRYQPAPPDPERRRLEQEAERLFTDWTREDDAPRQESGEEERQARARRQTAPLIVSLVEFLGGSEDDAAWLVDHLAKRGALVGVAGLPKVGKSTFVYGLLGALTSTADRFVGLPAGSTSALLMTEEPAATVEEKVDRFDVDDERVYVISRRKMGAGHTWPKTVAAVVTFCRAHPEVGVVVIDTWDKFSGLSASRSEADTGVIIESIEPLWELLGLGVCVILITHQRKQEGEHGLRVRGGTALTGSLDVIVEVERPTQAAGLPRSARVLKIVSRFADAPDEIAVELDDHGGGWRSLGTVKAAVRRSKRGEVLLLLGEEPLTLDELLALEGLAGISGRTVRRRLDDLVQHGLAERVGEGKRLDPYRWRMSENGRTFAENDLSRNDGDPADQAESFVTDTPPPRGEAGCHEMLCPRHEGLHEVEKRAAGYLWLRCGCRFAEERT